MSASNANPPATFADLCSEMEHVRKFLPESVHFFFRPESFVGVDCFRFEVADHTRTPVRHHCSRIIKKTATIAELRYTLRDLIYHVNR